MILRKFLLDDYEEVVNMYYSLYKELYKDEELGSKYFAYKTVMSWVDTKHDVIICQDGDTICGFYMAKIEDDGLREPRYFGHQLYTKEKYRKGRATHLMMKNASSYAREIGLPYEFNLVDSDWSDSTKARYNLNKTFTTYKGV